jgi:hypothetical protein
MQSNIPIDADVTAVISSPPFPNAKFPAAKKRLLEVDTSSMQTPQ